MRTKDILKAEKLFKRPLRIERMPLGIVTQRHRINIKSPERIVLEDEYFSDRELIASKLEKYGLKPPSKRKMQHPTYPKPGCRYISNNGCADNSGYFPEQPITLEQFYKIKIKDGDEFYFEGGQIYNWTEQSSSANNVTISSYGTGDAIFTGSTLVGNQTWTNEGGNIWSTSFATPIKWLTIDGECARQGQSQEIIAASANVSARTLTVTGANKTIVDGFSSLVGAKMRRKDNVWRISYEFTVLSYDNGTGVLTMTADLGTNVSDMPFWLYGQLQFLTQQDDWWYDSGTQTLYLYSTTNPTGENIRAITQDNWYIISGANWNISDIGLKEFYYSAIYFNVGGGGIVDNVNIHDCRSEGIFSNATTGLTVTNTTFNRCGLDGMWIRDGDSIDINNCTFTHIGKQANKHWPIDVDSIHGGAIVARLGNSNMSLQYNNVSNTAYTGFNIMCDTWDASYNIIHDVMEILDDGAAIYSSGPTPYVNDGGLVFRNICYRGIISQLFCAGIYTDIGSLSVNVIENTVYDFSTYCYYINQNCINSTISDNNFIGGQFNFRIADSTTGLISGLIFTNNVCALRGENGMGLITTTDPPFNPFTTIDFNYYIEPYGNTFSLLTWQTEFGGDANSTVRQNYLTYSNSANAEQEVKLYVNETNATINQLIPAGYDDVDGNDISNTTVVIPARRSYLALKQTEV